MNRRIAVSNLSGIAATSLLAALPVSAAFAQTMSGSPAGSADYVHKTLMIGALSKMGSQLALTNATHPKVREFAQFEVDEQTTVAQVLTNLQAPPPAPLSPMAQDKLSQLHAAGSTFDASYIQFELDGHQKLLQVQESYLQDDPSDLDRRHIAMLARSVIKMHLTMLSDLQRLAT